MPVHDPRGRGQDTHLLPTDPTATAEEVALADAARWAIEGTPRRCTQPLRAAGTGAGEREVAPHLHPGLARARGHPGRPTLLAVASLAPRQAHPFLPDALVAARLEAPADAA